MGKEQPASYYDDVYSLKKDGGNKACNSYRSSYKLSPYYEMWKLAISQTTKNNIIADLGCGVGQFASLCIANSRNYAIGIDFSQVAIEKARRDNPNLKQVFYKMDLVKDAMRIRENIFMRKCDTVFMLEVLEHITDDYLVIKHIPNGMNIIFSVPNYDSSGHVRFFESKDDVERRYANSFRSLSYVGFSNVSTDKNAKIFVFSAIK